ncbi:class I SAM-dependent methyltransferase [Nonomuraea sp. NPDC002799]
MRLTRWRVFRLRWSKDRSGLLPEGVKLVVGVVAILAFGAGLVLVSGVYDIAEAVAIVAAAFGLAALAFVVSRWQRQDHWVCPAFPLDEHPQVAALVADAARLAGFDRTPEVLLSSRAVVLGIRRRFRRPQLILGLPFLMGLSERDLHTIVVRELLTVKLWRRHEWYVSVLVYYYGGAALTEAFRPLRHSLWAAARSLVGDERLRAASQAEVRVDHAFTWHVTRYASAFAAQGGASDLYESFLWKIQHDDLLARIAPYVEEFAGTVPDVEKLFGEGPWGVPDPEPGMALRLSGRLERRLARVVSDRLMDNRGAMLWAKPYRLDEFPARDWIAVGQHHRGLVIDAATELLGQPATNLDVVMLARSGRIGELEWWLKDIVCPHPSPEVCALVPLFDVALRRKGYLHEQVFAQRVLIGPLGDRADVVELAAKAARGEPYGILLGASMTGRDPDEDAIRLATESLAEGDPTGWFERLYAESATGDAIVPWDSRSPHPLLAEWATSGRGRALVVGAGLGDDAEHLAGLGYDTVAFDVSESAVRLARKRFPDSAVHYQVADLLDPPAEWRHAFDLVVEIMTVQALPEELHARAVEAVAELVGPGGTLLVISAGRAEGGPVFAPPWPLTPSEIAGFATGGLAAGEVEELRDGERHRWRATFRRPA